MSNEKQFIGRVFPGNFHKKDGQTHLQMVLTGDDLNFLNDLMYEAVEANTDRKPLPAGASIYEAKDGTKTLQVKLEIKDNAAGDRVYCSLDTYQKPEGQAAAKPAPAPEPEKKRPARF